MKLRLTFLALFFISAISYAQERPCPFNFFISTHDESRVSIRQAETKTFPENEFNLGLTKKHLAFVTTGEYEGVVSNPKLTEHNVYFTQLEDGKYKLSFTVAFYNSQGNQIDLISEAYYDGTVLKNENQFYNETRRGFLFQDGNVDAKIDKRGSCELIINFKKPLYGVFSEIKFTINN